MSKADSFPPVLLAPIFYFIAIPVGFFAWIINEILRIIVGLVLWYKYGHRLSLVTDGCDSIWNYKTNGNTRNGLIAGICGKKEIDYLKIADSFEKQVLLLEKAEGSRRARPYEKLEKIMVTSHGYTCWKYDENFNVRRHFRTMNASKLYTEEDISEYLSVLAEDMGEEKPQWEWIIFPRYQGNKGEEKTLWILRFHHAYLDGLSLLLLLGGHFSDNKPSMMLNPITFQIPKFKKIIYYINALIYGPHLLVSMLLNKHKTYWAQNGPFPGGNKNLVSTPVIPSSTLKRIRANTGATIPVVVGTSFITAMKKVLPQDRILKSLRIGEIAALLPYKNENPQNRFANFSYDISTADIGENPQDFCDAIAKIKRDRLAGILGPEILVKFYTFKYVGRFPTFVLQYVLDGAHNSLFLSNVPTFNEELSVGGISLEEFNAWPPMPNQTGVTLASTSYNGQLKITGVSDPSWLTKEELQNIFTEIPKVIEAIADNSYIPSTLPSAETSELDTSSYVGLNDDSSETEFEEEKPLLTPGHETIHSENESALESSGSGDEEKEDREVDDEVDEVNEEANGEVDDKVDDQVNEEANKENEKEVETEISMKNRNGSTQEVPKELQNGVEKGKKGQKGKGKKNK